MTDERLYIVEYEYALSPEGPWGERGVMSYLGKGPACDWSEPEKANVSFGPHDPQRWRRRRFVEVRRLL